uniref:Uncharacterized protein n=1 Tax=Palpitomonas bilix TaxID=652834 RepID=A0A7S3GB59_9EUKA|mmetsp:Transcript_37546/g.96905  ORF Transcript_37546/g.96905 Transcript_37546/m.96905 type:complete len:109 (+) Transcript_37546:271-597(+)
MQFFRDVAKLWRLSRSGKEDAIRKKVEEELAKQQAIAKMKEDFVKHSEIGQRQLVMQSVQDLVKVDKTLDDQEKVILAKVKERLDDFGHDDKEINELLADVERRLKEN